MVGNYDACKTGIQGVIPESKSEATKKQGSSSSRHCSPRPQSSILLVRQIIPLFPWVAPSFQSRFSLQGGGIQPKKIRTNEGGRKNPFSNEKQSSSEQLEYYTTPPSHKTILGGLVQADRTCNLLREEYVSQSEIKSPANYDLIWSWRLVLFAFLTCQDQLIGNRDSRHVQDASLRHS